MFRLSQLSSAFRLGKQRAFFQYPFFQRPLFQRPIHTLHIPTFTVMLFGFVTLSACSFSNKQENAEVETTPETDSVSTPEPALFIQEMLSETPKKNGDVGAFVDFVLNTSAPVEYVMFKATAYDHDGAIIPAKRSGDPNAWLRTFGPFNPGQSSGKKHWAELWRNANISCFAIEGVELIYLDGLVEYYESDRISHATEGQEITTCT